MISFIFYKTVRLLFCFLLLINFMVSAFADTIKYNLINDYLVNDKILMSCIQDNSLYFKMSGDEKLKILDISNLTNIDELIELNLGVNYFFELKDNLLFYSSNAFIVTDISDIDNPLEIFRSSFFRANSLVLFNNYAIVENVGTYMGTCGIKIFDISDINKTNEVGNWFHSDISKYDLFFSETKICYDNYLFVPGAIVYPGENADSLLKVFNISNPSSIREVTTIEIPYSFQPYSSSMPKIAFANGYLYMTNGFAGLEIVNVDNPESPYIEANYPTSSSIENIYAEEDILYISYEFVDKVEILDIKEPLNPVLLYTDTIFAAWHVNNNVVANDKYVFISGYDKTFTQCRFHILEKTTVPSYNIPHIDWSEQWSSYLIADNGGGNSGSVRVYLYDKDGVELSMTTYTVEPYKTLKISLEQGECGKVDVFGDNITLKESFVNNIEGGIAEFALTNTSNSEINYLLPAYNGENLTWMGIALMNPGIEPANVILKAYDGLGAELGTISGTINPNTRSVGILTDYFPEINYTNAAKVKVISDQPVTGITISGNGNKQLLFTSANTNTYETGNLNITHIATEWNDWENKLIFDNTFETEAITSTLNLYNGAGEKTSYEITVNPMETKVVDLNQYSELIPESGTIENQNSYLAIRQSFISKSQKGTAEFVLTSTANNNLMYTFPSYASDILTWNGLSLLNPNNESVNANLSAYSNGVVVGNYSIDIEPHTRLVGVLDNFFTETDTSLIDKIIMDSTSPLTGINISGSNWDRLLFTEAFSISVAENSESQ